MLFFLTVLLTLTQTPTYVPPRLERIAAFEQQLNVIGSSWIVLDVEVDPQGNTKSIQKLHGESPLLGIAVANVREWVFQPGPKPLASNSHVTVVFLFRSRDLFSASPLKLSPASARNHPALPLELSDPGYPATSVGEGPTVLELQVGTSGGIERVRVVNDGPGLASHTEQAMRSWKFQSAVRDGKAEIATVIGVVSYLRPMLYINPPSTGVPVDPVNGAPAPTPSPPTFRGGPPSPRP